MRTYLLALIACSAALPSYAATAQAPDLILAASSTAPDTVLLDPIVVFKNGAIQQLNPGDDDPASRVFRAQAYAPGVTYWLYSGGKRLGRASAIAASEYGCTGLPGTAKPHVTLPIAYSGLAASDSTLGTSTHRRELTSMEEAKLAALAEGQVRRLAPSIPPSSLEATATWGVELSSGRRWLVGTYRGVPPADSTGAFFSALVVIESGASNEIPPLVWAHLGEETSRQEYRALDILDLNHDGVPELITSTSYYESWDYQIWQRRATAWELWITSGSAGC